MHAIAVNIITAPAVKEPALPSLPATIDEVVARLEAIIADCRATGNRAGYFAVLYHRVTCQIRTCIANQDFEDGLRMERLDVLFANRYIQAYEAWQAGKALTASWKIAFETAAVPLPLVLQHLLLGVNAHINLDLGIAAAATMQGGVLSDIRKDFYTINKVLADLVAACEDCMVRVNPLLRLLHLKWFRYDELLVTFSINTARDGAWIFANELSGKTGTEYEQCLSVRDAAIARLGTYLARPSGIALRAVLQVIRLFERKNVPDVIRLLGT